MAASEITAEAVDRFVNGVAAINYIDAGDKPIAMSGEMLDRLSPEASTSYWTSPSWETRRSSKKGPEIGVDGEMVMVSGAEKISGGKYSTNYPSNMEASTSSLGTSLYEEVLTDTVGGKEIGKSLDSGSKGVTVGDGAMRGGNAGGGGGGGGGGGVRKLGQRVVEMTGPWSLSPSSPSSSRSLSPSSSRSLSPSRSSSPSRTTPPSRSKPPSFKFMRRATCTTEGGVHEQLTKSLLGPRNPGDGEARGGLDGYTDADSSRARLENILENGCKNEGDGNGISGDKGKEMGTKLFGTKDKLDSHGQSVSELPTDEKGNPGVVNMTREMGFVGDNQLDVASLAVLKVFDAWEMQIVSTWHAEKGRTIVWMSVHYVDRKGLLADVSAIFSKHGIGIQTFSAAQFMHT
ncbi:hypothetical protein CBR_g12147 [Chara braunii]|uniref:ACT domain-containing protein n=1 Tax=Chara braunii TaxID=69332 RepID=A0A388KRB1_CHABU|nr:hypothetical protein CBR_g12147 [Chara braunii]|eukprot:GBG72576.1 hypothetical protein CBR_g12147 [Chara braunii]